MFQFPINAMIAIVAMPGDMIGSAILWKYNSLTVDSGCLHQCRQDITDKMYCLKKTPFRVPQPPAQSTECRNLPVLIRYINLKTIRLSCPGIIINTRIAVKISLLPRNRYIAIPYAVIAEKYAVSSVAGTATSKLFAIPRNRLKKLNTVSQFSFRCVLGISVKECVISTPSLVALTIIRRNGNRHAAASRTSRI